MGYKRMALAVGVGYVLGAKAGEKRYEQLKDLWDRASDSMSESPLVQSLREAGTRAAGRGMEVMRTRAQRSEDTDEEDSAEDEWEASDEQDDEAEEPEEGER